VGGYRDWRDVYTQNAFTQSAVCRVFASTKITSRCTNALRRHADGIFNAKTGRYDGISSAYRMKLVPVFVVDPDKPMDILSGKAKSGEGRPLMTRAAAMVKAVNTLVPQNVPPSSGELTAVDGIEIGPAAFPSVGGEGGAMVGIGRRRAEL